MCCWLLYLAALATNSINIYLLTYFSDAQRAVEPLLLVRRWRRLCAKRCRSKWKCLKYSLRIASWLGVTCQDMLHGGRGRWLAVGISGQPHHCNQPPYTLSNPQLPPTRRTCSLVSAKSLSGRHMPRKSTKTGRCRNSYLRTRSIAHNKPHVNISRPSEKCQCNLRYALFTRQNNAVSSLQTTATRTLAKWNVLQSVTMLNCKR